MPLNQQSGNMYHWISHTWNPIKGICPHDCQYCYMKRFPQKKLRLTESDLLTKLGERNIIFVGSGTDMWAEEVPAEWINLVLARCRNFQDNKYLFQSKNPKRFFEFKGKYPTNIILGTTIESNRDFTGMSKAPLIKERAEQMKLLSKEFPVMATIEPILDFDVDELVDIIKEIQPEWINIGADSKAHKMIEPSAAKIKELIITLKAVTQIRQKTNLNRLLKDDKEKDKNI